ncbi:MAG: hypothetical protein ABH877_01460 [bacterium]
MPLRDIVRSALSSSARVGFGRFVSPRFGLWEATEQGEMAIGERQRTPTAFLVAGQDGKTPRVLGWFPGWELFRIEQNVGRWAFFSRRALAVAGGSPPRVYIGDSDRFEFNVYDLSGNLVQIIRDAIPQNPIRDGDLEWERWELLNWAKSFGDLERWQRFADEMPLPKEKPAFEDLIVDSEGFLWVKEYSSYRPDLVQYRIYSPDGDRAGTVELPGRFRVFDVGPDYVLGVAYDVDYVETIQMYSLKRG